MIVRELLNLVDGTWDKEYTSFGENFKITEIQSAILNEQLKKVDKI